MKLLDPQAHRDLTRRAVTTLRKRFSLKADKASDTDIDEVLRGGVEMQGTNLWVLMFAIFIASIGLNVNSTAVIIGAMLISPLMGPIMGVGYGVGISDFELVRRSLKNLGIATLLALATSTAYFLVSPLHTVQSELLARTTPTIWDVMIALFGGLAGIVATTRKEKTNVIPGVAIATALMPPLCTAGFGLATANLDFFLGAFYLFTINSVFIALSSAFIVRALRVPQKQFVDARTAARVHLYLGMAGTLTLLPSFYLAYQLVGEEVFKARAAQFVSDKLDFKQSHVVATNINPTLRRIEVTLVGDIVPQTTLNAVAADLGAAGLPGSDLKVFQTGAQTIDVAALKSNLLGDLYKASQVAIEQKEKTIESMQAELDMAKANRLRFAGVPAELHSLYPQIETVALSEAPEWSEKTGWGQSTIMMSVRTPKRLGKVDQIRIEQWLRVRVKSDSVHLTIETGKK